MNHLHVVLQRLSLTPLTLHGVFMDVLGMGVLIRGDSGIGKSELALELISRGHRLVADDAPEFRRIAPTIIEGTCPLDMTPFLEVRGLGILNVQRLFGDSAVKKNKYLRLIINLHPTHSSRLKDLDRLHVMAKSEMGFFKVIVRPLWFTLNAFFVIEYIYILGWISLIKYYKS